MWGTLSGPRRPKKSSKGRRCLLIFGKGRSVGLGKCHRCRRLLIQGLGSCGFLFLESSAPFSHVTNFSLPSKSLPKNYCVSTLTSYSPLLYFFLVLTITCCLYCSFYYLSSLPENMYKNNFSTRIPLLPKGRDFCLFCLFYFSHVRTVPGT